MSHVTGQVLDEIKRLLRNLRDLSDVTLNNLLLDVLDASNLLEDVVVNCGHSLVRLEALNVTRVPYALHDMARLGALEVRLNCFYHNHVWVCECVHMFGCVKCVCYLSAVDRASFNV